MDKSQIEQVRRFNRTVTRRIGVLTDNYLGRGRPLGESRLLFEIGEQGANVRDLRARLALDSGYVSRLLRSLERQGFIETKPSPAYGRVRHATLTPKGCQEMAALDRGSEDVATSMLTPLSESQRERLMAAMAEMERLMRASAVTIEPADPDSAEARACIDAYF